MAASSSSRRQQPATPRSSCPRATPSSSSIRPTTRASTSQTHCESWDGDGAVRLLAYDPERRALLSSAAGRARQLLELGDDDAGDVVAGLLPRLWKPPPPTAPAARRMSLRAGSTSCPGNGSAQAARSSARCSTQRSSRSASSARRRGRWCSRTRTSTPATSCGRARAMARDRPQADRGRARVHARGDDPRPPAGRACRRSGPPSGCARRLDRLSSDLSLDRERATRLDDRAHDRLGIRARGLLSPGMRRSRDCYSS